MSEPPIDPRTPPTPPTPTPAAPAPASGAAGGLDAGPLSEEQLIDLIDGVLPPPQAQALLARAGRPDLSARVDAMRRDRLALRTLPDEAAPPELHDRIVAALEREALVGLTQADPALPPPAPRLVDPGVVEHTRSHTHRRRWWVGAPATAMAAGLALLVVGGAYFMSQGWRTAGPGASTAQRSPTGPIDPSFDPPMAEKSSPAGTLAADQAQPVGADQGAAAGSSMLARESAMPRASELAGASAPTALPTVDLARAVQLAAEGRLAVRVRSRDLSNLPALERAGAQRTPARVWRMSTGVPPHVLAAALPAVAPRAGDARAQREPLLATAALAAPYVGPGAAFSMMPSLAPRREDDPLANLRASYLLDLPQTQRGFDIVRAVFREQLRGEVQFLELPAPAATPQLREAGEVLWWTRPSPQWTGRVTVPVFVERR